MKATERVDFEIAGDAREGQCEACGAALLWQVTSQDSSGAPVWHPLDAASEITDLFGVRRAESHFAHCSDPDRFRRRAGG